MRAMVGGIVGAKALPALSESANRTGPRPSGWATTRGRPYVILVFFACGHAQFSTHNANGSLAGPCGSFSAEEGDTPGSVDVPEQLRAYGSACAILAQAHANSADATATTEATTAAAQLAVQRAGERDAPEHAAQEILMHLHAHAQAPVSRLRPALLPVACVQYRVAPRICEDALQRFEAALTDDHTVMLIDRALTREVLRELEWQLSDYVDTNTAADLGRLTGASHLVTITIMPNGNDGAEIYTLSARAISVETMRVATVQLRFRP